MSMIVAKNTIGQSKMGVQYENAPITEALIDIRVEPLPSSNIRDLDAIHELVKDRYPDKHATVHWQGQFSLGTEVGAVAHQAPTGFVFRSSDKKQHFQARLDGFTLSRLRPYGNWLELRDQARELWGAYRAAIGPKKIIRVAVRYINQIDIPLDQLDYKDYFLTTPEVSPLLPQELSGFFMQLQLPQMDFGGLLVLTQSSVIPSVPGVSSVILDLDVFKEDPGFSSDDEVWAMLEVLRDRKNVFFEGCLTDKTRALFGERRVY
jgi:uncharacterized protein (TIGR04255 family)